MLLAAAKGPPCACVAAAHVHQSRTRAHGGQESEALPPNSEPLSSRSSEPLRQREHCSAAYPVELRRRGPHVEEEPEGHHASGIAGRHHEAKGLLGAKT